VATPVCRLGEIALITRRSQVQILPRNQIKGRFPQKIFSGRAFAFWASTSLLDHGTTKSQKERIVPIADGLVRYLEAAIDASPSEYVFPGPDGEMMAEDTKVEVHPAARAGPSGRRDRLSSQLPEVQGSGRRGLRPTRHGRESSKCSLCGMQMWCKPMPRHLRFHDLRHTTATLILAHGGTLWEVTEDPGAQRTPTSRPRSMRISYRVSSRPQSTAFPSASERSRTPRQARMRRSVLVSRGQQRGRAPKGKGPGPEKIFEGTGPLDLVAGAGFEPATFGL